MPVDVLQVRLLAHTGLEAQQYSFASPHCLHLLPSALEQVIVGEVQQFPAPEPVQLPFSGTQADVSHLPLVLLQVRPLAHTGLEAQQYSPESPHGLHLLPSALEQIIAGEVQQFPAPEPVQVPFSDTQGVS